MVWSQALPTATLAMNSAYNRPIKETPHFLMFARDPRMPYGELTKPPIPIYSITSIAIRHTYVIQPGKSMKLSKLNLERAAKEYKDAYNVRFNATDTQIKLSDLVYIYQETSAFSPQTRAEVSWTI